MTHSSLARACRFPRTIVLIASTLLQAAAASASQTAASEPGGATAADRRLFGPLPSAAVAPPLEPSSSDLALLTPLALPSELASRVARGLGQCDAWLAKHASDASRCTIDRDEFMTRCAAVIAATPATERAEAKRQALLEARIASMLFALALQSSLICVPLTPDETVLISTQREHIRQFILSFPLALESSLAKPGFAKRLSVYSLDVDAAICPVLSEPNDCVALRPLSPSQWKTLTDGLSDVRCEMLARGVLALKDWDGTDQDAINSTAGSWCSLTTRTVSAYARAGLADGFGQHGMPLDARGNRGSVRGDIKSLEVEPLAALPSATGVK